MVDFGFCRSVIDDLIKRIDLFSNQLIDDLIKVAVQFMDFCLVVNVVDYISPQVWVQIF